MGCGDWTMSHILAFIAFLLCIFALPIGILLGMLIGADFKYKEFRRTLYSTFGI